MINKFYATISKLSNIKKHPGFLSAFHIASIKYQKKLSTPPR